MKLLFTILAILILAVVLALYAYQDPGWVVFARGHTSARMTLSVFIILQVVGFAVLYFTLRILITSVHMPASFRQWRLKQKQAKARHDTNRGLIELAQGNWARAEYFLLHRVAYSELPVLNYLSAAKAAQQQNAMGRVENYMALANECLDDAAFAVKLTEAELQLVQGQIDESLQLLNGLHQQSPKHSHVLLLLARVYELTQRWSELRDLLPVLRKHKVLDTLLLAELETKVYRELLNEANSKNLTDKFTALWKDIPKSVRMQSEISGFYARCLVQKQMDDQAEQVLREYLKKHWDEPLAYLYGLIQSNDSDRQLATAETWLKDHDENAVLLLSLGRLCKRNQLWGKAQSYLNASFGIQPTSETCSELASLSEQLEEGDKAAEYYKKAVQLAAQETREDALQLGKNCESGPLLVANQRYENRQS